MQRRRSARVQGVLSAAIVGSVTKFKTVRVLPVAALFAAGYVATAQSLPRTWIGGNVDWVDATGAANWTGTDEPDLDDEAIFNTPNTVNLGSGNTVVGLTLSGGINLNTATFLLTVDGLTSLSNSGTQLTVPTSGSLLSDSITLSSSSVLSVQGGTVTMVEESGNGLFNINAAGTLSGYGTVNLSDIPAAVASLMTNDGTISAFRAPLSPFLPPQSGTLTINANSGPNSRIDLDGTGGAGTVNVFRNQTLDCNGTLSDAFSGSMNLYQNSRIIFNSAVTLDTGTLIVDNGPILVADPFPDVPAGTAHFDGALTQTGGIINVLHTAGQLQLNSFNMTGGVFGNNGLVVFGGTTTIGAGANFTMPSITSSLTLLDNVTVTVNQADFNADGSGVATNVITIGNGARLDLNLGAGADTSFGGHLQLNGGTFDMTTSLGTFAIDGSVSTGASAPDSRITGGDVFFQGADVSVGNASKLIVAAVHTFNSTSTTVIGAGGTLDLRNASTIAGGTFSGAGVLQTSGSSTTVTGNATISCSTFDWDGTGSGSPFSISDGVTLTINSAAIDTGTSDQVNDPINLGGNGAQLIVSGVPQWDMHNTLTTNTAAAGMATIGGTSRFKISGANANFNVTGNTTVTAPMTFGDTAITTISPGATLSVNGSTIYEGGSITGTGRYDPPGLGTVLATTTISVSNLNFDRGNWTVNNGALLSINVGDYDLNSVVNSFTATVQLNASSISVSTSDAEFVMAGTLSFNSAGGVSSWAGEPLDIGNDAGVNDSRVRVVGSQNSIINAQIDFNSDADVVINTGASLVLNDIVNFDSVNGVNNAHLTGDGTLRFNKAVNVNEAMTIDMAGGTIDLDGTDTVGETIIIDAPFTLNAFSLFPFGRANAGGGINTLNVNNNTGTGVLTVNLDTPGNAWAVMPEGVLTLINDNAPSTLLSGSHALLYGTVSVFGDVRTTARVTMTGTVNLNTATEPFHLGGGNTTTEPNRIGGAIVQGTGVLAADTGCSLHGFGTINTGIDFDGAADLKADDGTLTINGSIFDVNVLGTADSDGVLNIPPAWILDSTAVTGVILNGGTLTGGQITNNLGSGITGKGFVSSPIINNTTINSFGTGATLVVQTPGNNNDWDGTTNFGRLLAETASTLELRDNASFNFFGQAILFQGATLFANGFELRFDATSSLSLANGSTYASTNSTFFNGAIGVATGTATMQVTGTATFGVTSNTTLTGNLRLNNGVTVIPVGAKFSGGGALINQNGKNLRILDGVNSGDLAVTLLNNGTLTLGVTGSSAGQVSMPGYQQSATGFFNAEIGGTSINDYDILTATGVAQLAGGLSLSLFGGYNPAYGQMHTIVTAGSVNGTFSTVTGFSQTTQKSWLVTYLPSSVRVSTVIPGDANLDYKVNTLDFNILAGKFSQANQGWGGADFNYDNLTNSLDFNILLSTYGFSVPAPAPSANALGAVVPEPATMSLIAVPAMLLRRRRQ